jgi:hypothetical protein
MSRKVPNGAAASAGWRIRKKMKDIEDKMSKTKDNNKRKGDLSVVNVEAGVLP